MRFYLFHQLRLHRVVILEVGYYRRSVDVAFDVGRALLWEEEERSRNIGERHVTEIFVGSKTMHYKFFNFFAHIYHLP